MNTKTFTHQLKEEVEEKLRQDPRVRDLPIDVLDNNGMIILQGTVPSQSLSMLVEDLARQVDNVISVSNELYVRAK
jgi:osmotically-inducible protein OsmY